ncbi:MAG: anthranilate synthase component I family protein [Thermoleophilaceae bacterium]|nr:anthranilate synthase component I family protein [Thermoleophilaceae bacterium]
MTVLRIDRAVDLWAIARELGDSRVALLDNPGSPSRLGDTSYLGLFPQEELRVGHDADPALVFAGLAELARPREDNHEGPSLQSGLIGYLAYELLHGIEPAVPRSAAPTPVGDLAHFVRFAVIVAVDSAVGCTWICGDDDRRVAEARELVDSAPVREDLEIPARATGVFGLSELRACGLEPVTDPSGYRRLVDRSREEISAGRFFEVCLTQEFNATVGADGRALYDILRASNPAPMGAYLRADQLEVLCTSPERLVSVSAGGAVETRPIKGTRPRSSDPAEDRHLREALAASPKDRAENTMIVDLARNDLGRVCQTGSVAVPELCVVESYASVHHLVSTVRGQLRPGMGPTDVIRACFPGGSMTGAPKVEAMRMISEVEQSQRGIFSGAIGWIGDDGAMDLNIVIRTLIKHGDQLSMHTGGAVTSDSDSDAEYAETMDKARVLATSVAAASARTVKA